MKRERAPIMSVLHKHGDWTDLDGVGVISGVLKQSVIRVEELPGEEEEELSRRTSVVQAVCKQTT